MNLKKGDCPDNNGFTIIFDKENEKEKDVTPEEFELINNIKERIKEAIKDKKLLADQLDLTNYKNIQHFASKNKYNYIFNIDNTKYCYTSSDITVFIIKTSYDYIEENNREELKSFKDFENHINEIIENLNKREEKIFEEARNSIISNANRYDAIDEKDNERVDRILMKLATFLAYAIRELAIYLFKLMMLLFYIIKELWKTLSRYIAIVVSGATKRWSDVTAGFIIAVLFIGFILGIYFGVIKKKQSPPPNVRDIDERDNANKKTLYSIILAIPSDISNAYNSFIKFTNSVNTMLFDAKKSFDDITTEMVYSEDSKLLEERIILPNEIPENDDAENIKKRIDYIMHFTTNGKDVNHVYNPKSNVPLTLGSNTPIGNVAITKPTGNNTKYTATCSTTSDGSEYIDANCKIKLIDATNCIVANSIPQESVQQAKKIKFENDYDHIIVST